MKRISITYGGVDYTIADEDLEAVKGRLFEAVSNDRPVWVRVNHGEGGYRATDLLVTRGTPIAVTGVDAE